MNENDGYQVLLVDLDGTVVDYARTETAALAAIHKEHFCDFQELAEFTQVFHAHNEELWVAYRRHQLSLDHLRTERFARLLGHRRRQQAAAVAARYEEELGRRAELFADSLAALHALRSVARLVLVSDGIAAVQHAKLARTGLRGLFEHVVLAAEVGHRKPDPALLGHALARAGAARGAALMVGDSPATDGAAAAAAGVDFCWVDRLGRRAGPDRAGVPAGVPAPRTGQPPGPPPARVSSRFRVPDLASLAACLSGSAVRPGSPGFALPGSR